MFATALQQRLGWQAAHEALTHLARARAGLDFEEGENCALPSGRASTSAWGTAASSRCSGFVPIDGTSVPIVDRDRQTHLGVRMGRRGSAHVGISAKSTSSRVAKA
jgi:hypothetical protein